MINEKEAPRGFTAQPARYICNGCYFNDKDCVDERCIERNRKDKSDVIFIKKESKK